LPSECHIKKLTINDHLILEIQLSKEEIAESRELGIKRTELDEKKLGWKYRHHGKKSEDAHSIGDMGEKVVEKWLEACEIPYEPATKIVYKHEDIKQDITIDEVSLGVKTMEVNGISSIFKYQSFLYPAKKDPGESSRVLGYPEYLIQVAIAPDLRKAWIIGYVNREQIINSEVGIICEKPAHKIPHKYYRDVTQLIDILKK